MTGGARSGKSRHAESIARAAGGGRTYLATAEAHDDEMAARIARHRLDRAADGWTTVEAPLDVPGALRGAATPVVLLDCLSLWASNLLLAEHDEDAILGRVDAFLDVAAGREGHLVVVSNEVGSGVVPPSPLGRAYRDALGRANQRVAAAADEAILVVAGLPLRLK